jgi:membrane-bound lytic murein transglycosylase D
MRFQSAVAVAVLSLCGGCGQAQLRRVAVGNAVEPGHAQGGSWGLETQEVGQAQESLPVDATVEQSLWSVSSHPRVVSLMKRVTRDRYQSLRAALTRSGRYIDMIAREFSREGVPPELAFLPIVESGFSHRAVGGSASGLWQLTRETAQSYGLVVNQDIDERNDPEKASHAAARLLHDLYATFERWDLALAAYNAGAGAVQRAREHEPQADFWKLADQGLLPSETRRYVPEALATMAIASQPEHFGLADIERYEPLRYETFLVQRRLDLRTAASLCSSTTDQIAELNPSLRRGVVPRIASGFELRIPAGSKKQFAANYSAMVDSEPSEVQQRPATASGGSSRRAARTSRSSGGSHRGRDSKHLGRA